MYREKVWNGSLGNTDIYTAFGIDFDKNGSSKFGKIQKEYKEQFPEFLPKYKRNTKKTFQNYANRNTAIKIINFYLEYGDAQDN